MDEIEETFHPGVMPSDTILYVLSHNGWGALVGEYRRIRRTPYIDCIKHLHQVKESR